MRGGGSAILFGPPMYDSVSDSFDALLRREPGAVAAFRAAAAASLDRFGALPGDRDAHLETAFGHAIADVARFRSIEEAGRTQGLRVAADALAAAALARADSREGGDVSFEQRLYARIDALPAPARSVAVVAFVRRESFADAIPKLGLDGAALAGAITELRRLVAADAEAPPAADTPAYVRVPFLVTGRLSPEDALRVREYLGESAPCRAAYRDLDAFGRMVARLGPECGEPHPEPAEWVRFVEGSIEGERRDSMAEHLRYCIGCEAVARALRSTAPRAAPANLRGKLDVPASRKRLAVAAVVLAVFLPTVIHALSGSRGPLVEVTEGPALDLGLPVADDPARPRSTVRAEAPGAGAVVSIEVPLEPNVAFDLRFTRASGEELEALGGLPLVPAGQGVARITLRLRTERLEPGDYELILLKRFRLAGGDAQRLVYPLRVEK